MKVCDNENTSKTMYGGGRVVDHLLTANFIISLVFVLCYAYQFFYLLLGTAKKSRCRLAKAVPHRYAVMISARNEEAVIGNLIESIRRQKYPAGLVSIFVVADNCTDRTAAVAAEAGALVFVRQNKAQVGKGYALEFLFEQVMEQYGESYFDGYFIFDADNLLDENYISEMNRTFSAGFRIVTSYRNSKNYGANWISSGYALWFLREARHLNNARMLLGTSCAVSGTGFLIHRDVINRTGGWKYFLLTEDIQFTVENILNGERVGYCHDAVLYDEQPETFSQSWVQRLRWAKGYYQVFRRYGSRLLRGIWRGSFACVDMAMTIMPAAVLTIVSFLLNTAALVPTLLLRGDPLVILFSVLETLRNSYLMLFGIGLVTGITEWKHIHASTLRKIVSFFTFPLFMLTYIPISIVALFKKVEWKPIHHRVSVSIDHMKQPVK